MKLAYLAVMSLALVGWRHARLQSTDGTTLALDFQRDDLGDRHVANPLWLNVTLPDGARCDAETSVFAWFWNGPVGVEVPSQVTTYLARDTSTTAACRFTVQLPSPTTWQAGQTPLQQGLKVAVFQGPRRTWQRELEDPVSRRMWFQLDLEQVPEDN